MQIIPVLITSLILISCGNKKRDKFLSAEQKETINRIQNPIAAPKDFKLLIESDINLTSSPISLFKKNVQAGETLLIRVTNPQKKTAYINEVNESIDYCKTVQGNWNIPNATCSSLNLFKQFTSKKIPLAANYSNDLPKLEKVFRFLEGWKEDETLYPEDFFIRHTINSEQIDIEDILEEEDYIEWLFRFDQDGLFELRFDPPSEAQETTLGVNEDQFTPCKAVNLSNLKLGAWAISKSDINSKGECPINSYILLSKEIKTTKLSPILITGKLEVFGK